MAFDHGEGFVVRVAAAIMYLSLCRVVPVLAEASVLSASALNLGVARFMAITALANIPIAIVYAAIGSFAVGMNVFWPAFGAVGLTLLLYLAAVPALQRKKKVSET